MQVFMVKVESTREGVEVEQKFFMEAENAERVKSYAVAGACHGDARWVNAEKTVAKDFCGNTHTSREFVLVAPEDVEVLRKYFRIWPAGEGEEWMLSIRD